jgi:16S rRNA processing protein RimM
VGARTTQEGRVELGRIVGAHALRGEVRVRYFGDGPDTLLDAERVWLGESRDDPLARAYAVLRAGTGRALEVRLALEGVQDRDAAEALRGRLVLVETADLAPLEADDYYWHELVGCAVETVEGVAVGVVRELWDAGRHDVLVVEAADGGQVLVPTAREIMTEVDREARRIRIAPVPGLLGPVDETGAEPGPEPAASDAEPDGDGP